MASMINITDYICLTLHPYEGCIFSHCLLLKEWYIDMVS